MSVMKYIHWHSSQVFSLDNCVDDTSTETSHMDHFSTIQFALKESFGTELGRRLLCNKYPEIQGD